jgi:DNA repair protein RadD
MIHLRDYQEALVTLSREAYREGHRSILCVAPTGTGKTATFLGGMVKPCIDKGGKVWVIVPKNTLIEQTSDTLSYFGMRHTVCQGGNKSWFPKAALQLCSLQSILSRIDQLPVPDLVINDEAHNTTDDNTVGQIREYIHRANPKCAFMGYTATPCRLDGKPLGAVYTKLLQTITINEAINEGFLIPPIYLVGKHIDLSGLKIGPSGDYSEAEVKKRTLNSHIVGDFIAEYRKHGPGRSVCVFCIDIEHSKAVCEELNAAGIPAAHIDTDTSTNERNRVFKALDRKEILAMCSVRVACEGFDLPSLEAVALLRPTASLALSIQMIGRGLRPANKVARDGEQCLVFDHAGISVYHGFVTDEPVWSLSGTVQARKREPREAEYECPACQIRLVTWPVFCPSCGQKLRDAEKREVKVDKSVELMRVDPRKAMRDSNPVEVRQAYYREVESNCFLTGKKAFEVYRLFKKKFGYWPSVIDTHGSQGLVVIRRVDGVTNYFWQDEWKSAAKRIYSGKPHA